MNKYIYTKSWFLESEIKQKIVNLINKNNQRFILEIGCYEGLSSVFFADNLLNHSDSTLTCVDPFLNIDNNDHSQLLNNVENNFNYNINICKNSNKITVHKITSDEFFTTNNNRFHFIYIDGCHEPEFIKRDMENSFECLENNGIMWMDDYGGGDGIKIKKTMDDFLKKYNNQYEIIHKGYQLAIRKL
jgi:predicted O-methyltransferase YrrM